MTGLLNFLNKAITPGRAFTRRMYAKASGLTLKPHHHIRLDREFRSDCEVWCNFLLSTHRGLNRPFIDLNNKLSAETLSFYTDAAKGESLGIGGIFGPYHWYFAQWEPGFIKTCDPSIKYLELLGVCIAVFMWIDELKNRRIVLHCDNQSVVTMINNTTAKCKNCMFLIRKLVLLSLKANTRVFCKWVRGKSNEKADLLSRQKISQFKLLNKQQEYPIDREPTVLPTELWPASKYWIK